MIETKNVAAAPSRWSRWTAAIHLAAAGPRDNILEPVADHPGLRQRERGEHADHVELDQPVQVGVERDDQDARERREDDHAVGEDEPVATVRELPGHVPVAREDRRDRGKPWYDVFAASTRIAVVKSCTK